jgi:hypothetical protein
MRWPWRFGASPDAIMKTKKMSMVVRYTALRPKVSENGPENREPNANPIRKRPK